MKCSKCGCDSDHEQLNKRINEIERLKRDKKKLVEVVEAVRSCQEIRKSIWASGIIDQCLDEIDKV